MKTVLITGGAKRLGRALVEHFAHERWRVLFTCRSSIEEGKSLETELGVNVHMLQTSVSTSADAQQIASWVRGYTNRLDLLICNASTFTRKDLVSTTPADFTNLLQSNLLGPYFLAQQCLPELNAAEGCIINIADAQAVAGVAHFSAYIAAKAGLISITKSLALELAPSVRVNAVLPGLFEWPEDGDEYPIDRRAAITRQIPLKTTG